MSELKVGLMSTAYSCIVLWWRLGSTAIITTAVILFLLFF